MRLQTWHKEAAVVAIVLIATVVSTGGSLKEWVGSLAVFFTFMHAQVANDMAEAQEDMPKPSVACYPKARQYFFAKEFLWLVYFTLSQTWAALAGVFVFLMFPMWRKYYRARMKSKA